MRFVSPPPQSPPTSTASINDASFITNTRIISPEPDDYTTPPFPSLYWPFPWQSRQSQFLYHIHDIWLFTLYWTLICYAAIHFTAACIAVSLQWRNWKTIWIAPVVMGVIGGVEALVGGSVVGGL